MKAVLYCSRCHLSSSCLHRSHHYWNISYFKVNSHAQLLLALTLEHCSRNWLISWFSYFCCRTHILCTWIENFFRTFWQAVLFLPNNWGKRQLPALTTSRAPVQWQHKHRNSCPEHILVCHKQLPVENNVCSLVRSLASEIPAAGQIVLWNSPWWF